MGSILDSSTLFRDDFVRVQDSNPRPNSGRSGGLPLDYVVADNDDGIVPTTPSGYLLTGTRERAGRSIF